MQKSIFLLLLSILLLPASLLASEIPADKGTTTYTLLNTEELKAILERNPETIVVDARNPEEYQEVHIKGAINIPEKQFSEHLAQLPPDKSARIIFYCNGVKCGKSKKAAQKALELGYTNVLVYSEGMPVWEEKGMPIYAGPDYEKRVETNRIPPQELAALIKDNAAGITVVDVRDPEEFKEGHIPGAINIPVTTFASQSGALDKEKQIIVTCNSGGRSYNAYRKLQKLGYPKIRQALFADWQAAGLALEKP